MWAMLGFFARKDHANTEFKVEFNSLVSDTWSSLSRRFGIYLILAMCYCSWRIWRSLMLYHMLFWSLWINNTNYNNLWKHHLIEYFTKRPCHPQEMMNVSEPCFVIQVGITCVEVYSFLILNPKLNLFICPLFLSFSLSLWIPGYRWVLAMKAKYQQQFMCSLVVFERKVCRAKFINGGFYFMVDFTWF